MNVTAGTENQGERSSVEMLNGHAAILIIPNHESIQSSPAPAVELIAPATLKSAKSIITSQAEGHSMIDLLACHRPGALGWKAILGSGQTNDRLLLSTLCR